MSLGIKRLNIYLKDCSSQKFYIHVTVHRNRFLFT